MDPLRHATVCCFGHAICSFHGLLAPNVQALSRRARCCAEFNEHSYLDTPCTLYALMHTQRAYTLAHAWCALPCPARPGRHFAAVIKALIQFIMFD